MEFMEKIKKPVVEDVRFVQADGSRSEASGEITFLYTAILSIERKSPTPSVVLEIILKDFRHFSLEFKSPEDCADVADSLEQLSRPHRIGNLYPFFAPTRSQSSDTPPIIMKGYRDVMKQWECQETKWRVSTVNKNYALCATYPEEVIVPNRISDKDLQVVAGFRQDNRFPIICYHDPKTKVVLIKCGQPLCGSSQRKCSPDGALLNACLPSVGKGRIIDMRTQQKAQHQTSKGGGVEFPSNYSQWRVEYASLESLTHLHASYCKLIEACCDNSLLTSSSWFGKLESSGWLGHVERLLRTAKHIVYTIHQTIGSVVVHGTTGKDATLQVVSLAIVLMDPYSRTIKGFLDLIQREWLDGGHPFSLRHAHTINAPEKERGPVFLLFLDTVWQVLQQYPLSFEFNEILLYELFIHSYSSAFGTFLYDTPVERMKASGKTQSLWDHLLAPGMLDTIRNPVYERNNGVLVISTHPCSIRFWKGLYFRSNMSNGLAIPEIDGLKSLKTRNAELKAELETVRKELNLLQVEGRQYSTSWK